MLQKLEKFSNGKNMVWNKVIATMLIITLTFANFILLGVVAGEGSTSYAADNLEAQGNATQHANVKFDAYFMKDGAKAHTFMLDANETTQLYFALNVKNKGYLKNASIELNSNNYSLAAQLQASEIMEKIENNKIILKQINYGTEAIVDLPILLDINNEFKKGDINKQSSLTLNGIYVTSDGREVNIKKEIKISLGWTGSINANVKSTVSKYIVNEDEKEIFLQDKIELSKTEKTLPIQKTILEIDVPKYNDILPEKIYVLANELGLTTGKQYENVEFNSANWEYNDQNGKLTIHIENKENNGNLWAGNGKDEYLVTYIYGQEAYNAKKEQNTVETNISANVFNYSGNEIKQSNVTSKQVTTLKEQISQIITGKAVLQNSISKGNMYANCNSNNREYETEYNLKQIVELPYIKTNKEVEIKDQAEQFIDENNNKNSSKIGGLNYTYYKETSVNKENIEDILGNEGYIIITNLSGTELGRIDTNTNTVKYSEKQDNIIIKTSKPISEGNLVINHTKAIKADLPYLKNQIKSFKEFEASMDIEDYNVTAQTKLEETQTKVNMTINKQTITQKEDVEIKLELNNVEHTSNLYKNPKFILTLPEYIDSAEIEKVDLLFENELNIKSAKVENTADGNKQIKIELSGTQTKFNTVPNTLRNNYGN